ncbi:hypothetical protein [Silicimonas algicola]|uniref:Uncharacterized protein n=1 Tax=Silicimonas algicola TaxID=1826607 RepID=A0A316FWN9_9RHOB|nr:hypothetical protein [Silicimonas algicola]PWK52752.1 hypothetical protein C8D95_11529 [Silicimonas algicola]
MAKLRRGGLDGAFTVYLLLGLALLLPALAVAFVLLYYRLSDEADYARQRAVTAADMLTLLSDARVASDLVTLRILAQASPFRSGDLDAGARRAQEAVGLMPGWQALLLTDSSSGESLFSVTQDSIDYAPELSWVADINADGWDIGGVERDGLYCPCVTVTTEIPGNNRHILTAFTYPQTYQEMLMQRVPRTQLRHS